jgi:hypothetical protein
MRAARLLGVILLIGTWDFGATSVWAEGERYTQASPGAAATPTKQPRRLSFTLRAETDQTYRMLVQAAEKKATNLVDQEFKRDPKVTDLLVSGIAERDGLEAPLLTSRVSRSSWRTEPDIQRWSRYYSVSAFLLGFNKPAAGSRGAIAPRVPAASFTEDDEGADISGASRGGQAASPVPGASLGQPGRFPQATGTLNPGMQASPIPGQGGIAQPNLMPGQGAITQPTIIQQTVSPVTQQSGFSQSTFPQQTTIQQSGFPQQTTQQSGFPQSTSVQQQAVPQQTNTQQAFPQTTTVPSGTSQPIVPQQQFVQQQSTTQPSTGSSGTVSTPTQNSGDEGEPLYR